jgi:Protein of unknown function (DUF1326)/Putative zinc-finger
MFCRNVRNNLSAYLQGELVTSTASSIEVHLAKCPTCRKELETIEEGIRMAEGLPLVAPPQELWQSIEDQIQKHKVQKKPVPNRSLIPRFALASAILILIAVLVWFFRPPSENRTLTAAAPQWSVNATVMEACSCPLFCQCYFNTKPAGHAHHGKEEHFCRTNVAYKINKGRYGSETLDGVKFWLAADVGSDFSAGQTEWAVLYFDRSLDRKQREAVQIILSHLMPVNWKSFKTAEAKIDRWEFNNDSAYASLDSGNAAVIQLKRFAGMTSEPVVIRNLKYWSAPRNDGFLVMRNEVQAYRIGPKAFEFKGTAGLLITFDMNSKDFAPRKQQAKRNSEKSIQPLS